MDKNFLSKCFKDKRWHALLVLIIWIIVLSLLMGIVLIVNHFDNTPKSNSTVAPDNQQFSPDTPVVLSYMEKLNNLLNQNYEFIYTIQNENEKIRFEGTKEDNIIKGYKQSNSGIIKYKIENQKTYQILVDKTIEITNLYDDIDSSLLDLNYLVTILNQVNENNVIVTEEENISTYAYNLTQDEEALEIIVTENSNYISQMEIHRNNDTYTLEFLVK